MDRGTAMMATACLMFAAGNPPAQEVDSDISWVRVPAGTFTMGSDDGPWDQAPERSVTLSSDIHMSSRCISVALYRRFRPDARVVDVDGRVGGVSWHDAVAFCRWLSDETGAACRLPTEAEWEYACGRSDDLGLEGMLALPREWCHDWYGDYPAEPETDPVGPAAGLARVIRGGGLDNDDDAYRTATYRAGMAPGFGLPDAPTARPDEAEDSTSGPGLIGVWFGGSDLDRPQGVDRFPAADQHWGTGLPKGNEWSARWGGELLAPATGPLRLHVETDGAVRLRLNGRDVIDGWTDTAVRSGSLLVEKDRPLDVELCYSHRGGDAYLRLSWSRAGMPRTIVPAKALSHSHRLAAAALGGEAESRGGDHRIGFRVVRADIPATPAHRPRLFVAQAGVVDTGTVAAQGPPADRPYFRKRHLLPSPPETGGPELRAGIDAAGLHPSFRSHNHSPAAVVCPNGDLLFVTYTSYHEYEPEVSLIATRLRFGADEWDMPSRLVDFPGVNDHAPLLWRDGGRIHLFWGNPRLRTVGGAFPFQWTTSSDNGASWSEVRFPRFTQSPGPHSKQPINSAFRAPDGTIHLASDGVGGTSVLWAGSDDGQTWRDTGGRSAGRHTAYALLKDGSILGMGGKNTHIDGFMPQAVSHDGGSTWTRSRTRFCWQGNNQRPSLIRLQSGRLFFAADFQCSRGDEPPGITQRGAFVALSDDEGKTWHVKPLAGTQPHERRLMGDAGTLGYSVARQAPNGLIHLFATMTTPCLHYAMNEAWILDDTLEDASDEVLMRSTATAVADVRQYRDDYPNGTLKALWSAGTANDGRYLLHGPATWYYRDGSVMRQAAYTLGRKTGEETFLRPDGSRAWTRTHNTDGRTTWEQWWEDGTRRAVSTWRGQRAVGTARTWDRAGNLVHTHIFE